MIGVLLVLASTAGVTALVSAQDDTVPVYAADQQLSTGDYLSADDLRTVNVQLPEGGERYLTADNEPPDDQRLARAVGEGELLPTDALMEADPTGRQAVTVHIDHDLARAVQAGREADIWAATADATLDESEATLLAEGAEVTDIRESSSTFGTQTAQTVELLVDPDDLPALLAEEASGAAVSVLPATGGELPSAETADIAQDEGQNGDESSEDDANADADNNGEDAADAEEDA